MADTGTPENRDTSTAFQRGGSVPMSRSKKEGWYAIMPFALAERSDLSAAAKVLLCRIRDRIRENPDCWPGQRQLCEDCGFGSRKVLIVATGILEDAGLLEVTRVERRRVADKRTVPIGGKRLDRGNRYALTPNALALFRPPDGNDEEPRPPNGAESEPFNGDERGPFEGPTVSKGNRERCQKGTANGVESAPKPDQENQTKRIRTKEPDADPWELAQAAMTGPTLRTEPFRAAWLDWTGYRRELRKPLTERTVREQIRSLEAFGHDGAIASIKRSIGNGWTGLFPPDDRSGRNGSDRAHRVEAPPGKYAGIEIVAHA